MKLGYTLQGQAENKVIVMNDWFRDCSGYASMIPFLNLQDFQFAFVDLRGYGESKSLEGKYSLEEATQDIIDTADSLGWTKFILIGYSMTGLVGQNVVVAAKDRVKSFIGICPVGAEGMPGADKDFYQFMEDAAAGDDEKAAQIAHMVTSNLYGQEWAEFRVRGWRETSIAKARVNYLHMFVHSNIAASVKGLDTPVLVISTSDDIESLRKPALSETFSKYYKNLEMVEIKNAGHSPMIETPVALATAINRHLSATLQK